MKKILYISYAKGTPFIEDTADVLKVDYIVSHYIISQAKLICYNTNEEVDYNKGVLNTIINYRRILKRNTKIDIVHFHMMHYLYLPLIWLTPKNVVIISSIWGSDFFQTKGWRRIVNKRIFNLSNTVTCTTDFTTTTLNQTYSSLSKKTYTLPFGLKKLDILKKLKLSNKKYDLSQYGIPKNKVYICIGYNASPNQNHVEIIEQLTTSNWPLNYHFIFPMTYGGNKKYKEKVLNLLENSSLDYTVIDKYMTDEEVSILRVMTDLLIQLQSTDQFSGSMQEVIYCKSKIITGSWLPYEDLIIKGIKMSLIGGMNDLVPKIDQVMNEETNLNDNENLIYEMSGFPSVKDKWEKLYNTNERY